PDGLPQMLESEPADRLTRAGQLEAVAGDDGARNVTECCGVTAPQCRARRMAQERNPGRRNRYELADPVGARRELYDAARHSAFERGEDAGAIGFALAGRRGNVDRVGGRWRLRVLRVCNLVTDCQ